MRKLSNILIFCISIITIIYYFLTLSIAVIYFLKIDIPTFKFLIDLFVKYEIVFVYSIFSFFLVNALYGYTYDKKRIFPIISLILFGCLSVFYLVPYLSFFYLILYILHSKFQTKYPVSLSYIILGIFALSIGPLFSLIGLVLSLYGWGKVLITSINNIDQ